MNGCSNNDESVPLMSISGLRGLQQLDSFRNIIKHVRRTMDGMKWEADCRPPVFVKISPDISEDNKKEIAGLAAQFLFDGLIISNTTISRPGMETCKCP